MTDTERERIAGMADVDDIKVYQAKSRVRRRIEEELTFDAELLEEHAPDLYEDLVDAVCPDAPVQEMDEDRGRRPEPSAPEPPEVEETGSSPVADPNVERDLEVAYREYLADRPPKKSHAKDIVVDALLLLRERNEMETGDLQDELFPKYEEHYSTDRTMWNAISRYLKDLAGFEKSDDYGGWAYAGDNEVWKAIDDE